MWEKVVCKGQGAQPALTPQWFPVSREKWQGAGDVGVELETEPKAEKGHPKPGGSFLLAKKQLASVTLSNGLGRDVKSSPSSGFLIRPFLSVKQGKRRPFPSLL